MHFDSESTVTDRLHSSTSITLQFYSYVRSYFRCRCHFGIHSGLRRFFLSQVNASCCFIFQNRPNICSFPFAYHLNKELCDEEKFIRICILTVMQTSTLKSCSEFGLDNIFRTGTYFILSLTSFSLILNFPIIF